MEALGHPSKHHDNGIPSDVGQPAFHLSPGVTRRPGFLRLGVAAEDLGLVCRTYLGNRYPPKCPFIPRSPESAQVKGLLWWGWSPPLSAQAHAEWGNLTPKEITDRCVCARIHNWKFPWSAEAAFRDFCFTNALVAECEVVLDQRREAVEGEVQGPLSSPRHHVLVPTGSTRGVCVEGPRESNAHVSRTPLFNCEFDFKFSACFL